MIGGRGFSSPLSSLEAYPAELDEAMELLETPETLLSNCDGWRRQGDDEALLLSFLEDAPPTEGDADLLELQEASIS